MSGYEEIRNVFESFEDIQSKFIFEKRLMYSLSKDYRYINEMVISEMKRYDKDDIMMRLLNWICDKQVWIFGAGFAGSQIIHTLMLKDMKVCGIVDNDTNKWGKRIFNIEIKSPKEIQKDDYVIIGTNASRIEIKKQLIDIGVKQEHIFVPDKLWWLGRDCQYFDSDVIKSIGQEVFIDGGALDGGDSINFIEWCNGLYDKIYAFEPDKDNFLKLKRTTEKLDNFYIIEKGMWSKSKKLKFSSGKSENSLISDHGDIEIDVISIDEVLDGKPVTYIKMDIEGSEMEALIGAEQTIKKYKPRLAICIYHKPEDIIDIPKKILEMNPNYRLYLRHYSYVDTETVLYAV